MDGCGITCVLFIWVVFLWPIISTAVWWLLGKSKIKNVGRFFSFGILVGYIYFYFVNFGIPLININPLSYIDYELHNKLFPIIYFLPQLVFNGLLFKKYS
jgi:hypothetical protein